MGIYEIDYSSIYGAGYYSNQKSKSQIDFSSMLLNSISSQEAISFNPQLMMMQKKVEPIKDIYSMSDSEFREMLITKHDRMIGRGVDMSEFPDPYLMTDEEISALKAALQERHEQRHSIIASGEMAPTPFMHITGSVEETQDIQMIADSDSSLKNILIEQLLDMLMSDANKDYSNNWFATYLQGAFGTSMSSSEYMSLYQSGNSYKV